MQTLKLILSSLFAAVIGVAAVFYFVLPSILSASVSVSDEYQATSTPEIADLGTICTSLDSVRAATLGSVVVTKTGTTDTIIYNATTSDVTKRTGNIATTSLGRVYIPASIAAGTYTFDVVFDKGILIDYGTNSASSTITCRGS